MPFTCAITWSGDLHISFAFFQTPPINRIMILKLHSFLFALPMLVVDAKRSQVMHSSGRKRHEAAKQALAAKTEHAVGQPDLQEDAGCEEHGGGCWWDSNCCGDMECLGVIPTNWACGYTPGRVGEWCNMVYYCEEDLSCHEQACTDYADLLEHGENEGTCKEGTPSNQLKVMTHNVFLINCPPFIGDANIGGLRPVPCQDMADKEERIGRVMEWVQTRDEDVIVFQELFNLRHEITDGMVAAGFCHYVVTYKGQSGSGSAIFSKYPIEDFDFWDYYDFEGNMAWTNGEAWASDRGIMHAEIKKGGRSHHVYNTHTLSNSVSEEHERRMEQYLEMREKAEGKSADDLVVFAGDMNENKYHDDVGDLYYREMLTELDASDPKLEGDQIYSYDNVRNALTGSVYPRWAKGDSQELLDYVLYSNAHLQPSDSSCEILTPTWPENCEGSGAEDIGCNLSDHYPVTCTFTFDAALELLSE